MLRTKTAFSALLAGIIFSAVLAGNVTAQVPIRGPVNGTGPTSKPARQEPCWEVAGISKATLQQRRTLAQQARAEVAAVCSNASLSIQQKRQQIRQIRERERQEVDGLISPAQQAAMRSCQEQRSGAHGGGHMEGGGGPCGEMSSGTSPKSHPMEEDEAPPNENAKPN